MQLFILKVLKLWLAQIQEMLHIEKGGDEQLKDELTSLQSL